MQSKKILSKKRLELHLYLSLFLYAVAIFGLTLLLEYIFQNLTVQSCHGSIGGQMLFLLSV